MQTLNDIEQFIANLPPKELAEFRDWFALFDADQWDKQFERDVATGKLEKLASQAIKEFEEGRCKEL